MSFRKAFYLFFLFFGLYNPVLSQPFNCDGRLILASVTGFTNIQTINFGSFGVPNYSFNSSYSGERFDAIGFNPKDNFIYGFQESSNSFVRLHSNNSYDVIGSLPNLDLEVYAGDCNPEGLYFCHENSLDKILVFNVLDDFELLREIDLFWDPTSVNSGPFTTRIDDFAFDPNNPNIAFTFQGNDFDPVATKGHLLKINLDLSDEEVGMVTPIAPISPNSVIQLESLFFTGLGQLFGFGPITTSPSIENRLFSINTSSGAVETQVGSTPVANISDGCSCPYNLSFKNDINPRAVDCSNTKLQFKFTINNASNQSLSNVTLTDTFPEGVIIQSVPPTFSGNIDGNTGIGTKVLTINNLLIAPFETVTITVNTEVIDLPVANIYNQAYLLNLPPLFGSTLASDDTHTPDFLGDRSGFFAGPLDLDTVKVEVISPSDCLNADDGKILISSPLFLPGNNFEVNMRNQRWEEFNYDVQINNNNRFDLDSLLPGEYKLVQIIPQGRSCGFSWNQQNIMVEPPNELLQANVGTNSPICEGDSLQLNSTIFPEGTVSWTGPNAFNSSEFNPEVANASNGYSGTFEMVAKYGFCEQIRPLEILVTPEIEASIAGKLDYCEREKVSLIAAGNGDLMSFSWSGPVNFEGTEQELNINSMAPFNEGSYQVIIDNGYCTDTATTNISMLPSPTINLPGLIETDFCTPLKLRPVITGDNQVDYSWTRQEGLSCYDCPEPELQVPFLPSYKLTVLNDYACADTTVVQVSLLKENLLYVPNAFSPNFDGRNDYFQMFPYCGVVGIKNLEIFNRWGANVFSKKQLDHLDPQEFWDGRIGNEMGAMGVYIWQAEIELVDGSKLSLFGDVSLLR